jgi:mono/diheme cytochrome c family protein
MIGLFEVRGVKHRRIVASSAVVFLFLVSVHTAVAQQVDAVEAGRQQFEDKCAVCHGVSGTGDGVLAPDMNPKPADLTRISERNSGTFPSSKVFAKIWGRDDEIINTHEITKMPAFYIAPVLGNDKEFESSAGRLSPAQIRDVISFLTTIQE